VLKPVDPDAAFNGGDSFSPTCALVLAAGHNHADLVQVLLDGGVRINQRNEVEQTACHIAAERGHLAALNGLIARGANLALPDSDGAPPLFAAAYRSVADAVCRMSVMSIDVLVET
jgi:ankyrin repeat protein